MRTGQNFNKLNNKGFSLVELIVVIAIMTVLTATVALSTKAISNSNVNKVSSGLSNGLARTQQLCMAKQSGFLTLQKGTSGWEMEIDGPSVKDHKKECFEVSAVDVKVFYDNGTSEDITSGKLILSFSSNGAFKERVSSLTKTANGTSPETYTYSATYSGKTVNKIQVSNANGKVSEITIQPHTGHYEKN